MNIIVVAADEYKNLARTLSHQISKIPGCNGTFWTVKHYEDNEPTISGRQYVILIGNAEENPITKDFLPVVSPLHNRAGACFGYDGSKAVVFGEGKLEQAEAFERVLETSAGIVAGAAAGATVTSLSLGTGALLAAGTVAFPIVSVWVLLGGPLRYLGELLIRRWREKKLRKEQTKAALTLFLAECFDAWVGIEKPE